MRWVLVGLLTGVLAGCVPTTAAYLSIPLESEDETAREAVELRVSLAELELRMASFDPDQVAFFTVGRNAIPHRFSDEDGDGRDDVAIVVVDVAADGSSRLIVLCPGPPTTGEWSPGVAAEGVVLNFDASRG